MSSVRLSGPTNSTMLTTCCGCAILEHQRGCPRCKEDVYPYYEGSTEEYSSHQVRNIRWRRAYWPERKPKP